MRAVDSIDYGDRLRVGLIVPSGNVVAEPEIHAMLPAGVRAYVTRLPLVGSTPEDLQAMVGGLDAATDLLGDAAPDVIAFHCTAATTVEPGAGAAISGRITARTGTVAFATSQALLAALDALGARRLALLTPYTTVPHTLEQRFLEAHGAEVVTEEALGLNTNTEMAAVPPDELADLVLRHGDSGADAFVLSCTALRSGGIVEALEARLGRPVLTSNQVTAWYAARVGGVADPSGVGVLAELPRPSPAGRALAGR